MDYLLIYRHDALCRPYCVTVLMIVIQTNKSMSYFILSVLGIRIGNVAAK